MPTWLVTGLVSSCVVEAVIIAALAYQRARRPASGKSDRIGEISCALAHELNQPLTAILSSAQAAERVLAQESLDRGELRELLSDVIREDKRAGEVICRIRAMLKEEEARHQPSGVD
jgi:signal transduction histidine kinase